jgi:DNA-binding response OmpR family regulator
MILLAEDEFAIREAEAAYLRHAGYNVAEVNDGNEALAMFESQVVELVVLDINLPHLDGLAVCRHIRSVSDVPIIMVTARNSDADELIGLESGADDYIRKPFNPRILIARVQTLLARTNSTLLHRRSLEIDPLKATLIKAGRKIELTKTQFNILYRLMEHPDTVLSRRQLIAAAKDDDYADADIFDRTIDSHIKAIRKKVEDDPACPVLVKTVIGKGYTYEDA